MPDTIGGITVPEPTLGAPDNTNTFPLRTEYGFGKAISRPIVTHTFGQSNAKVSQRFYSGDGATRYTFKTTTLTPSERAALINFWEARYGPTDPFYYNAPLEDGTTSLKVVRFENAPLSVQQLSNLISTVGVVFVEMPDPAEAPQYTITTTCRRFPDGTMATNLTSQVQEIIPLVTLTLVDETTGDELDPVYLSDRRVVVGGNTYLPRLLRIGEQGSEVLFTQSIDGASDQMSLTFGNADRVMVQLANSTPLMWGKVELCLFRVNSKTPGSPPTGAGTLLELWAGYIHDWKADAGPEFTIQASDILTVLTRTTPVGDISRTCWRRYGKDGCPAIPGSQTLDLVHFPNADANTCDLGYATPNGCMAHTVKHAFGGHYCTPQGVYLRSKGAFGITKPDYFPKVSIIADNIYGMPLAEVWHNDEGSPQYGLPVPCQITAGRDEDDFYNALGIVGRGPLGAYTDPQQWDSNGDATAETFLGSTLDGFPNHGYASKLNDDGTYHDYNAQEILYGLRQVLGTNQNTDYFSVGRTGTGVGWDQVGNTSVWMNEVTFGASAYYEIFASDTAFMEIKRMKGRDDPLTTPQQHAMIALVSEGLTARTWTAPGTRVDAPGCTNSFWVALNTYLFSLGLHGATYTEQEKYFDVASAIDCADVADLSVDRVIGTGQETQFMFKGVINDRKSTRDWLRAIMTNCLGYYTWEYGKLKFGVRCNSSAVAAFNANNVLFQSLVLEPVHPSFEKLTAVFNDQEYRFQQNTVTYTDQDHAGRFRRAQNPLAQILTIAGCPTKSQAGRVITVRTREELGGVTAEQQRNARTATWKSTILALDTEAGMVVSVAGDDVPTTTGMTANTMEFRIQKWTLNRDWSVTFYGSTTHDDMYDIVAGPKPEDVEALPIQEEPFRDMYTPSQPYFDVAMYPKDPGAALISNLHFPDVPHNENTSSMKHGAFTFLYVKSDEYAPILSSGIDADDTSITLNNTYHVTEGDLRLIDGEIVLFGAPSGNTVPITRGLYTSTAVAHDAASRVYLLHSKVESVSFPSNFFHGTKYPYWTDIVRLPNTRVAVVLATMTNDYGDSPQGINLLTNNEEYGLVLYDTTYPVLLHSDTEVADVSDPIWDENEHTFGLQQAYESTSDGNMTASLVVNTKMPIREFLENTDAPLIGGTSTTGSGGSLPDNTTYMISVCAYNADGYTPVSDLQVVKTGAGGGDNKITLSGITWPEGTYDGYVVFAAQSDLRLICAQDEVEDTLPSSINFTGPWKRSTWNMPSVDFRKVIVKAKKVWHSGVLGSQVTSVSTNTIVCSALANLGDDWSGRVLTILANVDDTTSVKNFSITGYTDSTGTFTCSPDPLAAGVEVDDVFVVRFKADTITSTSIGDSGLISGVYPDGDIPDHKVGKYVWVILGTGRGQIRKITANTATTYTIDRPWKVTPNSSSTWIIVEPSWQYRAESEIPESYDKTALAALPITAANLGRQTYCVAGFIRDVNGVETPEDLVLPREFWLFGALGNVISTERLTFNFQGDLENPDTVDVPLPVTLSQNTLAEVYEVWATISTPAVGADIVFDLKWSEDGGVTWADSLFPSTRTLPAGETSLVYRGEDLAADPLLLRRSFWVKPYISGIGSTTPGADLSITVRYRIREDNTSEVGGRIGRLGGASYQRGTATNTGYKLRGTIPVGV